MSAILIPALLLTGLLVAAGGAEEIEPGKITTLTGEQVQNLKPKGDSMRFGKLAELTPEVAAALASQRMELEFTAVENPILPCTHVCIVGGIQRGPGDILEA
jgi:hypothetical protein